MSNVQVAQSRDWWGALYTIALSELTRALGASDPIDVRNALQVLPELSEAAQSPELDAMAADMRAAALRTLSAAARAN